MPVYPPRADSFLHYVSNCSCQDPVSYTHLDVYKRQVEQKTDYEKLVLEISTDGSIHPKEALKEAAKILIYHFMLFSDEKITLESNDTCLLYTSYLKDIRKSWNLLV